MEYRGINVSDDFNFRFAIDGYRADDLPGARKMIDDLYDLSFEHRGILVGPTGDDCDRNGNGDYGFSLNDRVYRLGALTKNLRHDFHASRDAVRKLIDALLG